MPKIRRAAAGLVLGLVMAGCGPNKGSESSPPPGVSKNDHPNTTGATGKRGKPFLAGVEPKRE